MKSIGKINLKKVPKDKIKELSEDEKQAARVKLNGKIYDVDDPDDEEDEEVTITKFLIGFWDDPYK